jgi:hypothetical protein
MKTEIKKWIKKNWALIGFVLAFILEQKTGIIGKLFPDPVWQETVKGLGGILLAYYWNSADNIDRLSKKGPGAGTPSHGL